MKVEVWVRTWRVGSRESKIVEIDDEDLEGLTTEEQAALIDEVAQDSLSNLYEWGWKPVEPASLNPNPESSEGRQ